MTKKTKRKGFTLVEMLVVIAIIALLVSIIIPTIHKSTVKAAGATNAANLRAIEGKISSMRVENPQIFQSVIDKAPSTLYSILTDPSLSPQSKFGLALSMGLGSVGELGNFEFDGFEDWLNSNMFGSDYVKYHVYHNTADANNVITISVIPSVAVYDVPRSEECNAGDMQLPADLPMTVYVSDIAVVATYEYGGNSYTKDDFAIVAETGEFEGAGSGGMTGGSADCTMGRHSYANCKCINCGQTDPDHKDSKPRDHICDNGCGDTTMGGEHKTDENLGNGTHGCDYCGEDSGNCVDNDSGKDHTCDVCGYSQTGGRCGSEKEYDEEYHWCSYCERENTRSKHSNWDKNSRNHDCGSCDYNAPHNGDPCSVCGYGEDCVTPDTLVTLADGSQVRVDSLTGEEELLVWNHYTGSFDSAPVAYIIDHGGEATETEVVHMTFANGSVLKFIGEHVFYVADLNAYVAVTSENADSFVGSSFLMKNGDALEKTQLVKIERTVEVTEIYEVVSYKYLTCFTENILTSCAYLDLILNPFEIDPETLAYDSVQMQADIEKYGLMDYGFLSAFITRDVFDMHNCETLLISIGKGKVTLGGIFELIQMYYTYNS